MNSAFTSLLDIAGIVKSKSPVLPTNETLSASWAGIGFSLLQQRMIAPLSEIVEMLPVPEATRLPGVSHWVVGVANFRGRLLPLFDLDIFFSGKSKINQKKRRVLVLELGDLYTGLIVNEVYGMQYLANDIALTETPEHLKKFDPYSKGSLHQDGIDWLTFSPFELVKDPNFFDAAIR